MDVLDCRFVLDTVLLSMDVDVVVVVETGGGGGIGGGILLLF
jgi:hypothetical protein